MKKLLPILSLLALVQIVVLVLPPAASAADAGSLRIGVEGAYPPFSSVGPNGQLTGFDIDIAKALCTQMKVKCTLVQQDFDGLIPALKAHKFDAVVASMSITPERLKVVDFSNKYYQTPARLIARVGNPIDSVKGFSGKRIGVQRSTIHDRYATAKFAGAEIVRYTKQDDVFLDLVAGRIDATLVDSVAGDAGFLKTPAGKGYAFTGPVYDDPAFFGKGAGIAVRQGDTVLKNKLNAAIEAIRGDGVYKTIEARYFDFDVYGK